MLPPKAPSHFVSLMDKFSFLIPRSSVGFGSN